MTFPSVAWLLVAAFLALLISQNAELDFLEFAWTSDSVQQLYDVSAYLFGHVGVELVSGSVSATRRALERCGVAEGDLVLELGFGSGVLAQALVDEVGVQRYDGVELSEAMLNLTTWRLGQSFRRNVHLYQNDEPLKLLDSEPALLSSYSHAFAIFVLDALAESEIKRALEVIHARLRPGGRLCAAVLADLPQRVPVRLYKTFWRSAPVIAGCRRPVALQRFFSPDVGDGGLWTVASKWLDEDEGLLPTELFVLDRHEIVGAANMDTTVEEGKRAAALQRWSQHVDLSADEALEVPSLRRVIAASAERLPLGVAKDAAVIWMSALPNTTLISIIDNDIQRMTKDDILTDYQEALSKMHSAQLLQEIHVSIRAMDSQSLEDLISPPTEEMTFEELRDYVDHTLDNLMEENEGDANFITLVLKHKDSGASAQSRDELLALYHGIEGEYLVSPADMSRDELERTAIDHYERMSRQELIDELVGSYQNLTVDELRGLLRDEQRDEGTTRVDREVRAQESLLAGVAEWMRPVVREIASEVLTDEEVLQLAAAIGKRGQRGLGPDGPMDGLPAVVERSYPWPDEL